MQVLNEYYYKFCKSTKNYKCTRVNHVFIAKIFPMLAIYYKSLCFWFHISKLLNDRFLVSILLALSAQTEFPPMNDKEEKKIIVLANCICSSSTLHIVFKNQQATRIPLLFSGLIPLLNEMVFPILWTLLLCSNNLHAIGQWSVVYMPDFLNH